VKGKVVHCVVGAVAVALGCLATVFGEAAFGEASVLVAMSAGLPVWVALPVYVAVTLAREQSLLSLWRILACAVSAIPCAILARKRSRWLSMIWYATARLAEIATVLTGADWWRVLASVVAGGVVQALLLACRRGAKFTSCGVFLITVIVGAGARFHALLGAFGVGAWVWCARRDEHALREGLGYLVGGLVASGSAPSFCVGAVALLAGSLAAGRRWWTACAVTAGYLVASLALGDGGLLPCAAAALGSVLGALLPLKKVDAPKLLSEGQRLSRVLRQSASSLRGMEIAFDGEAQDEGALASAFAISLCAGCTGASACAIGEECFCAAVKNALASGRAGFACIPDPFIEQCRRAQSVPTHLATVLSAREHDLALREVRATAHALVRSELNAFSGLLSRTAELAERSFTVDGLLSSRVSDRLGERVEVATHGPSLRLRTKNAAAEQAQQAMSEAAERPLILTASEELADGREYCFAPEPSLAVTYGVGQVPRHGQSVCGDTYTVRRVGADVVLAAVCDGMGSGMGAHILSERTVGVLESCFSAGFTTAEILPIANFLLHLGGERFSCVDLVVIDLAAGQATFVKMGSVESYLVRGEEVFRIDGESLPLGVERSALPSVATVEVRAGDLLVVNSDGVSDALELPVGSGCNPQAVADAILVRALHADGGAAHDDMTTLVLRAV